ncbi:FecR family protein [Hansschlegelia plantiphila]|nr:FecR domain-containing protein [Hansschlegelia plantiphila]
MASVGNETASEQNGRGGYVHQEPVTDQALEWRLRFKAGDSDPAETASFEAWLASDPRNAAAFARLDDMLAMPELREATLAAAAAPGSNVVPLQPKSSRKISWGVAGLAAAAALLLATGLEYAPSLMRRWTADYVTAAGDQRKITLPDGSRMTLNASSAAALDFEGGRRGVRLLDGEAFFEVIPDAAHPFRVTSRFSEVEVKGTAFAVHADAAEDVIALDYGRVEVSRLPDRRDTAELSPGDMVTATDAALSSVTRVDPAEAFGWTEGRIVFYEKPFSKAIGILRRYYDGAILIMDPRLRGIAVSGNYRLDDPEGAIQNLAEAAGATMTRLPGGVIVLR